MHPLDHDAHVLKSMHLADKTCTQGAPLISNTVYTFFVCQMDFVQIFFVGEVGYNMRRICIGPTFD